MATKTAVPLTLRALRMAFGSFGAVLPELSARAAERLFFTPRRYPRPSRERTALQAAARLEIPTREGVLAANVWDERYPWERRADPRTALLVHGWEGRGSQLHAIAEVLAHAGCRVVAIDAPAHGDSAGTSLDLLRFAAILVDVGAALGPVAAVVAHSMGGAATLLALREGLVAERVVTIGAPARAVDVVGRFVKTLGIPEPTVENLGLRIDARLGPGWQARLSAPDAAAELRIPALIIHDTDDNEIPYADAVSIVGAWPTAELMTTRALGHRKILRDPAVLTAVAGFVVDANTAVVTPRAA